MSNWTSEDARRLRELEALDSDGVSLSADECAELEDLMNRENQSFIESAA